MSNTDLQPLFDRLAKVETLISRLVARDGPRRTKGLVTTITGDQITVRSGYHILAAETGTTDDLANMASDSDGAMVVLRAATGHTIDVVNTGNIDIPATSTLIGTGVLLFIYDLELDKWLLIT